MSDNPLNLPDLASRAVGGTVVGCSDEFFAEVDNLLTPGEAEHRAYTFGAKGQVYDGWETRRRRSPGHDWALVRLGVPGVVRAVVVDTAHFLGNFPESCEIEACHAPGYPGAGELAAAAWTTLVPRSPLAGDERHVFDVAGGDRYVTHLRLIIHPDGGVARLRAHGEPVPDPAMLAGMPMDLAAMENGGRVAGCSDMFFGAPGNLLLPGQANVMGEGWETRRRRDDGNDWATVALAAEGTARVAELDTRHFKGNCPGEASLRGWRAADGAPPDDPDGWAVLLPRTPLRPDTRHRFRVDGAGAPPVTHVRLDIHPDGGMARLRLFGDLTANGAAALDARWRAVTGAA